MELNPHHPTTAAVRDHWHTLAFLLLRKLGADHVVITPQDLVGIEPGAGVSVQELPDGLHLRLVSAAEAQRLARVHGGRPS